LEDQIGKFLNSRACQAGAARHGRGLKWSNLCGLPLGLSHGVQDTASDIVAKEGAFKVNVACGLCRQGAGNAYIFGDSGYSNDAPCRGYGYAGSSRSGAGMETNHFLMWRPKTFRGFDARDCVCLLYTSDAADD
jgi:hypothetical protein